METKWASLISYQLTADLLQEALPISTTENSTTIRHHLHKVAKHQESELEGKLDFLEGCPRDWGNLPKRFGFVQTLEQQPR